MLYAQCVPMSVQPSFIEQKNGVTSASETRTRPEHSQLQQTMVIIDGIRVQQRKSTLGSCCVHARWTHWHTHCGEQKPEMNSLLFKWLERCTSNDSFLRHAHLSKHGPSPAKQNKILSRIRKRNCNQSFDDTDCLRYSSTIKQFTEPLNNVETKRNFFRFEHWLKWRWIDGRNVVRLIRFFIFFFDPAREWIELTNRRDFIQFFGSFISILWHFFVIQKEKRKIEFRLTKTEKPWE